MTAMWEVRDGRLQAVARVRLDNEDRLEDWLAENPRLLGLEIMIIGRQVLTDHGGRIDLLGIDRNGDLVILELKRDRTPREIVAQILDYASWIADLTTKRVHELALEHLSRRLSECFEERFGESIPENLNGSHSMVIIASELDEASKRIVQYLSTEHGIGINTAFFNVFRQDGREFVVCDWLMDEQQVAERSASTKRAPWSGYWYVNIMDAQDNRSWKDQRRFGFVSAGGGSQYSDPLRRLDIGDPLFAYLRGVGYVGYGIVRSEATIVGEAQINGQRLIGLELERPEIASAADDPEMADYIVAVEWKHTVDAANGKRFKGIFANPNIVCQLRHEATIDFLKREFSVPS